MKIVDIDPVVYGWCRDHGYSVLDHEAASEFGIWCADFFSLFCNNMQPPCYTRHPPPFPPKFPSYPFGFSRTTGDLPCPMR